MGKKKISDPPILDDVITYLVRWKKIMKFCNFGLFKAFEESYLFVMSGESKLTYFMTK